MGQRHQVYLRLPAVNLGKGNPNNEPTKVIGLHHQWLYGQTAIKLLRNALRFIKNQAEYGPLSASHNRCYAQQTLNALYSLNAESGYFHGVHTLDAECNDPRRGDNNDGITIIDCAGDQVRYCFWSLGDTGGEIRLKTGKPYSAEEYVRSYYPRFETETKNARGEDTAEFHAETKAILAEISSVEVLDLATVKEIFPAMFPAKKKSRRGVKALAAELV